MKHCYLHIQITFFKRNIIMGGNSAHIKMIQQIMYDLSKFSGAANTTSMQEVSISKNKSSNENERPFFYKLKTVNYVVDYSLPIPEELMTTGRLGSLPHSSGVAKFPHGIKFGNIISIDRIEHNKYQAFESLVEVPELFTVDEIQLYTTNDGAGTAMDLFDGEHDKRITVIYGDKEFKDVLEIWFLVNRDHQTSPQSDRIFWDIMKSDTINNRIETDDAVQDIQYRCLLNREDLSTRDYMRIVNTKYGFRKDSPTMNYGKDTLLRMPLPLVHKIVPYFRFLYKDDSLEVTEILELDTYEMNRTYYFDIWCGVKLNPLTVGGITW